MADPVAIAIERERAHERLVTATKALSEKLGVGEFQRPLQAKDPGIREYQMLDAIAEFIELVTNSLPKAEAKNPEPTKDNPQDQSAGDGKPTKTSKKSG